MKASKYSLLAWLYFFFNSLFLPKGLLYTLLLSPLFFFRQLQARRRTHFLLFVIILGIFDLAHLVSGVELKSFLVSNAFFICVYFFTVSAWYFVKGYGGLPRIFREVLAFNSVMVLVALLFLPAARRYQEVFWYFNWLTTGFTDFPRLAMLTYEASYYALLICPVCMYYILKFATGQLTQYRWLTLFLAVIPLLLSLSFGVIGGLLISAATLLLVFPRSWLASRKMAALIGSMLLILVASVAVLYFYAPDNVLFVRISNILSGNDTSARGRTSDSFNIAWKIADSKSLIFGAGLGQVKFVIVGVVKQHYNYWGNLPRYDIPNAMAETLAIFGLAGVVIRLGLQVWLFFRQKVYDNLYSLALFVFMFIYQFTGSFITNSVEYAIWIIIFARPFAAFDLKSLGLRPFSTRV